MQKVFFIIHFGVIFGSCQLIRFPSNTALVVGERLELVCQPNVSLKVLEWKKKSQPGSDEMKIFKDFSEPMMVYKRFGYIKDDNSVTIYLNSTKLGDAGSYECFVRKEMNQPQKYSVQVIVLETEPICEDNISRASNDSLEVGSTVWMRCRFNFRGNITPIMEWRQHGGSGEMFEDGRVITEVVKTTDTNISSTLTLAIGPNSTDNATFFSCKTYFQWNSTDDQNATATNDPDYSYTWNSSVIILSKQTARVSASTSDNTINAPSASSMALNPTYLVAGVAVLFGIVSSLVAVVLCLRLRRQKSAAIMDLTRTDALASDYDLIPYACTDAYATIGEVNVKDDINFPPRLGPLPAADFLDQKGQRADERVYDGQLSESNYAKLLAGKDSSAQPTLPNSNSMSKEDSEEMPSTYLQISEAPLQFSDTQFLPKNSNVTPALCPNPYLALSEDTYDDYDNEKMPSAYLKISKVPSQYANPSYSDLVPEEHYNRAPALCSNVTNPYLALSEVDNGGADEYVDMLHTSRKPTVIDKGSQSRDVKCSSNTKQALVGLADDTSSIYLIARDTQSSE